MPEVPYPRKNHRQSKPVGSFNDFLIAHRPSWLDDRRRPGFSDFLDSVREGEKCI
jgi:hypothetical protein